MKVDNFVLLIISIVTLIIISLLTECNRERLTELENKATKEIVETFFHLGSADPTEPGQWGYQITGITEGKYGGRSRQQVINKLLEVGSHSENDYITETEKDAYGSGLFDSNISGIEKNPVDCTPPIAAYFYQPDTVEYCEDICVNNKLTYKYTSYVPAKYGGECPNIGNYIIDDNGTYKYITKANFDDFNSEFDDKCLKTDGGYNIKDSSNLLEIIVNQDNTAMPIISSSPSTRPPRPPRPPRQQLPPRPPSTRPPPPPIIIGYTEPSNTIHTIEPNWCGFFSLEEVSEILFNNSSKLSNASTLQTELSETNITTLYNNQFASTHSLYGSSTDIFSNYNYKKFTKDDKYYNVIYEKIIFTNCGSSGKDGKDGPTQTQCENEYDTKYGLNLVTVDNGKQIWTVPKTGEYKITTIGADGGSYSSMMHIGGKGYLLSAKFNLSEGDKIKMTVGQQGYQARSTSESGFGGGGGTFVWKETTDYVPIIISGGGGGGGGRSPDRTSRDGGDATGVDQNGGNGKTTIRVGGGTGGEDGNGGAQGGDSGEGRFAGSGGGGLKTRGGGGWNTGGGENGGGGGDNGGGFGGGGGSGNEPDCGAAGGGGGGYNGGGGGGGQTGGVDQCKNFFPTIGNTVCYNHCAADGDDYGTAGGGGGSSYVSSDHILGSILEARIASSSDGRSNRDGNGEVIIEYLGPQIGSA